MMSHYAEVINGIVQRVIVADQDFIDTGSVGNPANWIQTSYNTKGGVHNEGGTPLRKNYAGGGYTYDKARDAFIPPQTFPSWILDESTCLWVAPIPMPTDGKIYRWNEALNNWEEAVLPAEQQAAIATANEVLDAN